MEIGLREVLIVVGLIVIAVVLFDGYRRVRQHRRGELKFKLDLAGAAVSASDDIYTSELPSGGARRVIRKEPSLEGGFEAMAEEEITVMSDMSKISAMETVPEIEGDISSVEEEEEAQSEVPETLEVIILNIMAPNGEQIEGELLLKALLLCGMRFGEMSIFHSYESVHMREKAVFSLANCVEPGTFDPDNMSEFTTPGVCLFLELPGPLKSMKAFERLLLTAHKLADELNAQLYDEQRRPITQQTLERLRQKVLDVEQVEQNGRPTLASEYA